jgi:hypothetical protein
VTSVTYLIKYGLVRTCCIKSVVLLCCVIYTHSDSQPDEINLKLNCMRFRVLIAVAMKGADFWDVSSCTLTIKLDNFMAKLTVFRLNETSLLYFTSGLICTQDITH